MALKLEKKFNNEPLVQTKNRIAGYASLFEVEDEQGDIVSRGAFVKSINKRGISGIKMLWQHDPMKPIGYWEKIYEDEKGLYVEGCILDDIAQGKEALSLLKARAVTGLSIGYRTLVSGNANAKSRILQSLDLWEISLVTFPMLKEAEVGLMSGDEDGHVLREFHSACQDFHNSMTEKNL